MKPNAMFISDNEFFVTIVEYVLTHPSRDVESSPIQSQDVVLRDIDTHLARVEFHVKQAQLSKALLASCLEAEWKFYNPSEPVPAYMLSYYPSNNINKKLISD